ncbi:MAG: hypothetical protein KDD45_04045, partial [Bdellovibrionales bacterium]|nr:hypothetical protein [Bdellovibrionales bacterium]
ISKPSSSFVGAKNSSSLVFAKNWGSAILNTAIHHCLWNMYGKNQTAPHNYFSPSLQFKTETDKTLNFNLPNGKAYHFQNNYNQDKGYLVKNNSDGSHFPKIQDFKNMGLEIISLKQRPIKNQKNGLVSGPGWVLTLKTNEKLSLNYFLDITKSVELKNKLLTSGEESQIYINNQALSSDDFFTEIPKNSEIIIKSGYSFGVII